MRRGESHADDQEPGAQMLNRRTRMIAACAVLAMAGTVGTLTALAAGKKHHPKHKATAAVTKAQVLTIIQQYLAAHPAPTPPTPPTPPTYTAGTGLKLTSGVFSFDSSVVQARETANCPSNQLLQGLGVSGVPSCLFAIAPATGTSSNVTLSAIRQLVASATASAGGHQLAFAQVAAHRTSPQTAGDSIGCVLNDLTAAPGTDFGPAVATFPNAGAFSSFVDIPLQSVIPTNPGDTIAVSCTGGSAGFVVDNANIALIPLA